MDALELRKLRLTLDLTQAEMGLKLGVSRQMYNRYERGKAPVSELVELKIKYLPN